LLRAARAGLRFVSTQAITVHKFAAGHRYLSFLSEDAEEQWGTLEQAPWNDPGRIQAMVDTARRQGRFMTSIYPDYSSYQAGELFGLSRRNKGVVLPELQELSGSAVIEQTGEPRGLDWYDLMPGERPYRWSGPNRRSKILIPYTSTQPVRITLCVADIAVPPLGDVGIELNGATVDYAIERAPGGDRLVIFPAQLKASACSILTLHTPVMANPQDPRQPRGIAVGDVILGTV
jgi:hypothetical protein